MCVKIKISLILLFITILVSCKKNTQVIETSTVNIVKTVRVEKKAFNEDLDSFGTITYKTKNNVTALVEGTLEKLYIKEGNYVKKGQLLGKLRNVQLEIQKEQAINSLESAKAALLQAETNLGDEKLNIESRILSIEKSELNLEQLKLELEEAKINLQNNNELLKVGGITESAYKNFELTVRSKETEVNIKEKEIEISKLGMRDEDLINNGYIVSANPKEKINQLIDLNTRSAKASVESAKANLSSSQKNLDSINKLLDELKIIAPVSGIIGVINFENGEHIPQNESILVIMDVSEVYAIFSIHEQDIQYFVIGDSITVDLPSINQSYKTKLTDISPIADSTSGNFTVKAILPNTNSYIKPGMFVKCTILRSDKNIMYAFPETCLVQKDGNTGFVFIVINDLVTIKQVKIEKEKDGYIWISTGLKEKDIIIDKPSPFLKEGEKVEIH